MKLFLDDGIPEEIMRGVRYSEDIEQLDGERAGYVVEDDDIDESKGSFAFLSPHE